MGQPGVHNSFSGNATYVIQAGEIHGDIRIGDLSAATHQDRAAAELARLVQAQWREEAAAHGLSRRAQLAVRWTVDTAVADHRENIGGRLPLPRAEERGGLATLAESYRALPVRRLVVLGGAGAGKTSLAILLTLELLRTLAPGEPVPVLLRLSSWNPESEHFDAWLARAVLREYPTGSKALKRRWVRELVRDRRLVPVVDGLDELPGPLRAKALDELNRALGDDAPIVLTSRSAEYVEAVGRSTVLGAATVIRARPVPGPVAAEHLRTTAAPADAHRWTELLAELTDRPDGVPARALSSPLMLWLARTVYARSDAGPVGTADPIGPAGPAELLGPTGPAGPVGPAELLDRARFPEPLLIERHLLDALVPSAFPTGPPSPNVPRPVRDWGPERAERGLRFLAAHLTRNRTAEFAWWRLHRARLPAALEVPLAFLAGFLVLISVHPLIGLLTPGPAQRDQAVDGVIAGAVCCVVGGLWTMVARARRGDRPSAVAAGLGAGPGAGPRGKGGAGRRPLDARALLRAERLGTVRTAVVGALVVGAVSGLAASAPEARTAAFTVGAYLAVASTLLLGLWSRWLLAKALLAVTDRLPWSLIAFLEDARRVGVLRQIGGVYEFRHARLQARLAAQWRQGPGRASPSARLITAPRDGGAVHDVGEVGEVRFQGRTGPELLRGRAKLYAFAWGLALARVVPRSEQDGWGSPGAWTAAGILLLLPVLVDFFAPAVARRRSELRLDSEAVETTVKGRTVRYRWADVTQVAVRLFDEDDRGADLPMLHLLLTPGAVPAPGSRLDEAGWLALWPLGHGDETTVMPELDAALRQYAGSRWAGWELEE